MSYPFYDPMMPKFSLFSPPTALTDLPALDPFPDPFPVLPSIHIDAGLSASVLSDDSWLTTFLSNGVFLSFQYSCMFSKALRRC